MRTLIALLLLAVAPAAADPPYGSADAAERALTGPAAASAGASRVTPPSTTAPPDLPAGPDLYAPPGLSGCDEFRWYRQAFGLPAVFDGIAWRESNCRQELGVHTSCCWGWLQLNVAVHLADHRLGPRYRNNCGVYSRYDVDGPEPADKWRHVCAAAQLYEVEGLSPW